MSPVQVNCRLDRAAASRERRNGAAGLSPAAPSLDYDNWLRSATLVAMHPLDLRGEVLSAAAGERTDPQGVAVPQVADGDDGSWGRDHAPWQDGEGRYLRALPAGAVADGQQRRPAGAP